MNWINIFTFFIFVVDQIIDGQQVEVVTEDEDEGDETQVLAVEGEDGQQYVVLEVIQPQVLKHRTVFFLNQSHLKLSLLKREGGLI